MDNSGSERALNLYGLKISYKDRSEVHTFGVLTGFGTMITGLIGAFVLPVSPILGCGLFLFAAVSAALSYGTLRSYRRL